MKLALRPKIIYIYIYIYTHIYIYIYNIYIIYICIYITKLPGEVEKLSLFDSKVQVSRSFSFHYQTFEVQ